MRLVSVSAPAINYVFSRTGQIAVTDFQRTDHHGGRHCRGVFQSRMFTGEVGTPAAGRYGFEYRIDITEVGAVTGASCISALTIDFGPVVPMDFAGDGQAADGYVVVQGGLGSIAPSDVTQRDNQINVCFLSPKICASGRPGGSPTTFRVLVARPCWRGVTGTLGTASAAVPAWPVRWFADRNWS